MITNICDFTGYNTLLLAVFIMIIFLISYIRRSFVNLTLGLSNLSVLLLYFINLNFKNNFPFLNSLLIVFSICIITIGLYTLNKKKINYNLLSLTMIILLLYFPLKDFTPAWNIALIIMCFIILSINNYLLFLYSKSNFNYAIFFFSVPLWILSALFFIFPDSNIVFLKLYGNGVFVYSIMILLGLFYYDYNKSKLFNNVFSLFIDSNNYVIFTYNTKKKRVTSVSNSIISMIGYTPDEIIKDPGLIVDKIVHKDDYPIFEYVYTYASNDIIPYIIRLYKKNGEIIWTEQKMLKVLDKKNNLIEIHGSVRDITKEKETEFALIESKKKYEELFENSGELVLLIRLDNDYKPLKIAQINRFALERLKYSFSEIENINPLSILAGNEANEGLENIITKIPPQKRIMEEIKLISKNNDIINVEMIASIIIIGEHKHLYMICRDVTDRIRIKKHLHKIEEIETLNLISGGIAHDFNNILTALIGDINLSMIAVKTDKDPLEYLKEAEMISFRARDLTHQLLTFSKEGTIINPSPHLNEIIKEVTIFTLRGTRVKPAFTLCSEKFFVNIDETQFSRVISNLIVNAKQAMNNKGEINIKTEIREIKHGESDQLTGGDYVLITIQDTGEGISPEILPKIFTPFFTTKKDGNGLGLASSFAIINNHKGAINLESTPGFGTTFHIYLPITENIITDKKKSF